MGDERKPVQQQPGTAHVGPAPATATKRIPSDELLAGGRQLEIDHQGEVYRLQLTKQGKLILTK